MEKMGKLPKDKQILRRKGMTLIEIMIILALVTIMVSLGYYSLRRGLVRQRIRGAYAQLKSDIIYLRQRTFATSQYMGVIPSSSRTGYQFVVLDSLPAYLTVQKEIKLPPGVKFGNIFERDVSGGGIDGSLLPADGVYTKGLNLPAGVPDSADNWVLFTPRGTLAWGEKKYIYITNGVDMYGLRINIWGKVDAFVYSGGGWSELR